MKKIIFIMVVSVLHAVNVYGQVDSIADLSYHGFTGLSYGDFVYKLKEDSGFVTVKQVKVTEIPDFSFTTNKLWFLLSLGKNNPGTDGAHGEMDTVFFINKIGNQVSVHGGNLDTGSYFAAHYTISTGIELSVHGNKTYFFTAATGETIHIWLYSEKTMAVTDDKIYMRFHN